MDPRQVELRALEAQQAGDFVGAIALWNELLKEYPNWELGYSHYSLADCYTRIGELDLAEEAYKKAMSLSPQDTLFSNALESFVSARAAGYLHQAP